MEKIRRIVILPRELYEQIRTIAQRDHRSLSGQIVHWLAQAVARDQEDRVAEAEKR